MLFAALAQAQTWDGQWKQSALKEEFTVQQWLPGCGPAPSSHSSGGGETVTITQEGDELSFVGGGKVFKSNQCYDDMPTLARESHSRDPSGKVWRTHCSTPAGDPRRATMNTLVQVTSDSHIDLAETGRYEITLTDGKCTADIKRTRGFDLVKSSAPVASATAATATATATAPPKVCTQIGDPARLEVRPSKKLMKLGDTFTFNAVVLDANGCGTGTKTTWAVESGAGVTVDPSGLVTVAADATEGTATIVATAAGKSAKVTVEVSSAAHYADLLASSGLNSSGESDVASTAVIASSSLGAKDAHSDDSKRVMRRNLFIAVVGGLTLLLAIVALVGFRRSKRAAALAREAEERHEERMQEYESRQKKRAEDHAAQQRAHEESVKKAEAVKKRASASAQMECPSCRREYPPGSQFCPHDGSKLQPQSGSSAPLGNVCPVCKRGYDSQTKICPADGEELVPQAAFRAAGAQPAAVKPRGKICPTCGGRFEGEAVFCGKDGTALVLLN